MHFFGAAVKAKVACFENVTRPYTQRAPQLSTNVSCKFRPCSYLSSRSGEDAFVIVFVDRDDVVGAEFFLGVDAGDLAHFAATV